MSLTRAVVRTLVGGGMIAAVGAGIQTLGARLYAPYLPDVALQAGMELLSKPRRVLAIGPHPGDLEFFLGGTLFLLAHNHSNVTMAVLSRGENAGNLRSMGRIREREQEASAHVLGSRLLQYDWPDSTLTEDPRLVDKLARIWRRVRPDVLFAFDPKGPLPGGNPDHAALGHAVYDLARRGVLQDTRVYFYATRHPNVLVDTTEVIQEKVNAVQCHRSQLKGPDALSQWFVRSVGRMSRSRTPAMYTESLARIV